MKRVMLAVLGLLCVANLCMAQFSQTRVQHGNATRELRADGMSAAHSIIPVGSKVKVTNPANGMDIEVTVVAQIPASINRIIDLSHGAAQALDIGFNGGPVIVTTTSVPLPPPAPLPPEAVPPPPALEPVAAQAQASVQASVPAPVPSQAQAEADGPLPINIIINNYIVSPERPLPAEEVQERPVRQIADTEPVPVYETPAPVPPVHAPAPVYETPAPVHAPAPVHETPAPVHAPAPVYETPAPVHAPVPPVQARPVPLFDSPPVTNIRIIPGLPNPNSDKVYRILVGTYPGLDSAFRVHQQLQAAGFNVVQEQAGEMCRVFASGIPASRVYYAAQRLGAIGFEQVWIQE
ncbi:MAG: hypothetical protein LBI06_08715 [Treponema sp.]|jgi:hypothetical protein|nr:hypothetical protein [Treponema sp.]